MVVLAEALDREFYNRFIEFVKAGEQTDKPAQAAGA
jgi:hypothetical protein